MELLPCPFCGLNNNIPMVLNNKKEKHMPIHTTVQCTNCGCEPNHYLENENDAIKIWNTRHSPWISVKDRLPEDGQSILVWIDTYGRLFTANYGKRTSDDIFYFNIEFVGMGREDIVTHWMPLPKLPELK